MVGAGRGKAELARRRLAAAALAAFALVSTAVAIVPAPALAQEQLPGVRRQGLLDLLFRRERPREALPRRNELQQPPPRRRARSEPASRSRNARPADAVAPAGAASAPPAPAEVAKRDDARTVLVIGDFFAAGLAEGLSTAFAEMDAIRVATRTNGSSGLVRDDFYDWPREIGAILAEEKPASVVVMLGSNDRQEMVVNGTREPARSPAWTAAYQARAKALATALKTAGVPFVWVGTPPFRFTAMSADMLAQNDIYKAVAEEAGGTFVDIWTGFSDESGAFSATGPDINGQPARLRGNDGINLTRPGKRKLAFFVEKPLLRLLDLGPAAEPGTVQPGTPGAVPATGDAPLAVVPEPAAPVDRTVPVSLADPGAGDGLELLGAAPARKTTGKNLVDQMVRETAGRPTARGRADDFAGPSRGAPAPDVSTGDSTTSITR